MVPMSPGGRVEAKGRQDTSRWRAAGVALLLLAAGCADAPPPAAVSTPFGEVRAATPAEARALAASYRHLRPAVLAALPDTVDDPTDVWQDDSLGAAPDDAPTVAAFTTLSEHRIHVGTAGAGMSREFLLAHELVHAELGPGWDPLPAIMKEGLCDAIACRVVPADAATARALRLFAARFAFGDQELLLACEQPAFGGSTGARLMVASTGGPRRAPLEALALEGHGVPLREDADDQDVLYGYGLLLVERVAARGGLEGLHALCDRARREGRATLPVEWVLDAADLDATPASWTRALAEALREPELTALADHLSEILGGAIVSAVRWRFPDLDGEEFLRVARPSLGLRGGDLHVDVNVLPALRAALLAAWQRQVPAPMGLGAYVVRTDSEGLHAGSVVRAVGSDAVQLQWVRVEARPAAPGSARPAPALDEALVRLGRDAQGPYLASTLPYGFAEFRVEVLGVAVADLRGGLNVRTTRETSGATTLTCRLDPAISVDDAFFYGPRPTVLVLQRAAGDADDQRFPIAVPLRR